MNPGLELDLGWINEVNINFEAIKERSASVLKNLRLEKDYLISWLLKALTCLDLTTLGGDDTTSNVHRLCLKAVNPLEPRTIQTLGLHKQNIIKVRCAAVCVYPARVADAYNTLKSLDLDEPIPIAAVAAGFPSGQYSLHTRLEEIKYAVEKGASEIDIVIDRSLVLKNEWQTLYQELQQMRQACGQGVHMKSILAVGELGSFINIYKASLVAMMAGSDFIKTSTGKESINATLPVGIVMCRAIHDYYTNSGYKVGIKPAGGIRTSKDALKWLVLIKEELGEEWLDPKLFRIGASGLLNDIDRELYRDLFR